MRERDSRITTGKGIHMNFYPKSFAIRLLICVGGAVAGYNLGTFIRHVIIGHAAFPFSVVQSLILPAAVGLVGVLCWRPREQ